MSPDAKLKFEMMKKDRAEKKVDTLQAELNELKDRFIVAMERKERPGTNELQAKEIVSLRGQLAKGKSAYQAEVKRGDALLIERGDYAAEVLSLKMDLKDAHAAKFEAWDALEAQPNKYKDHARALKAELHAVRDNRDEIRAESVKTREKCQDLAWQLKASQDREAELKERIVKLEEIKLDHESIIKAWRPLIMAGA